MSNERIVRAVAGTMILIGLAGHFYLDPRWIWLSGFVGLNLLQSSFTNFCPLEMILKKRIHIEAD